MLLPGTAALAMFPETLVGTYVASPPASVPAGTGFVVAVMLTNSGTEAWKTTPPGLVDLSYHWYDAAGATGIWGGARPPPGAGVAPPPPPPAWPPDAAPCERRSRCDRDGERHRDRAARGLRMRVDVRPGARRRRLVRVTGQSDGAPSHQRGADHLLRRVQQRRARGRVLRRDQDAADDRHEHGQSAVGRERSEPDRPQLPPP